MNGQTPLHPASASMNRCPETHNPRSTVHFGRCPRHRTAPAPLPPGVDGCTLVTPYNPPSPRWLVTSSLSHRMSFGVAPGELANGLGGHRTPVREFPKLVPRNDGQLSFHRGEGWRSARELAKPASCPGRPCIHRPERPPHGAFVTMFLAGDSDCRWYLRINWSRKKRSESNKREQRHS